LVTLIKGKAWSEGFREQDAEEDIWNNDGVKKQEAGEKCKENSFVAYTRVHPKYSGLVPPSLQQLW
jgi:hypothetical protein